MKVDLEEVESLLLKKQIDPTKVSQIINELEKVAEELAEERKSTAGPKQKFEHIIVLNDTEGFLKDKEISGWVIQKESNIDTNVVMSSLADAAKSQNEVTKKKANIISDLTSLFEHLKSKFTKEKNLKIKTKELTRVIVTEGKLV